MYALIDPNVAARYISSWAEPAPYTPVYTEIGQRVADVAQTQFPIAPPYFWFDCAEDVVADQFYFDEQTQTIIKLPPDAERPKTSGPVISEGFQPA